MAGAGIKPGTVYGWVSRGTIPHRRLGSRLVRFDLEEVAEWVETKRVSSAAQIAAGARRSHGSERGTGLRVLRDPRKVGDLGAV